MTRDRDFKRLVRERMARTGERYTTARMHLLAEQPDAADAPALRLGGEHDQTAALRDVLVAHGVDMPHTDQPPSEALLLGLGGGLGAAVFTFQYQGHLPHLYIETRCTPQYAYDGAFIERAAHGLGATLDVSEAGAPKKAAQQLDAALEHGHPVIAWVDAEQLAHHGGGRGMGAVPWTVVVHQADAEHAVLTDRSSVTWTMPRTELDAARASHKKGKHRIAALGEVDTSALGDGVRAGVRFCVDELAGREARKGFANNFGLRALERWAESVTATNAKGWAKAFAPGPALAAGLQQAYWWVVGSGTGGAGFRGMYADFLREAAQITGDTALEPIAQAYDALAAQWVETVSAHLPDGSALGDVRAALDARADAIRRGAPADEVRALIAKVDALVASCDPFPGDAQAVYADLGARLESLVAAERAAASRLEAWLG